MPETAGSRAQDDCEHTEFEIYTDSVATDIDPATMPYGRVTQRARCVSCRYGIERTFGLAAWGPWRASSEPGQG
jgi:hypothetical protein